MIRPLSQHIQALVRHSAQASAIVRDGSRHADFLPGTLAITEKPPAAFAILMVALITGFFLTTIVWMAFGMVDELALGSGKVRPLQQVQTINHPVGGKIASILVKAGDHVQAHQVLLTFDPETVREEVGKRRIERDSLIAEVARLEAEAADAATPVFPESLKEMPELVATQIQLFTSQQAQFKEQMRQATSVIAQKDSAVVQAEARLRNASHALDLTQEQTNALHVLADKGYYPKLRVLAAERELSGQQNEVDQSAAALVTARAEHEAAKAHAEEIASSAKGNVLKELAEKRTARDRAIHEFDQINATQNGLELTAPVSGYVENIKVSNPGQSVLAGQDIMHVVPDTGDFLIDTRVSNKDIGHIRAGQTASIKLHAFDYQRFGSLTGVVTHVPVDGQNDEKTGEVYYTVTVKPDQNYLGGDTRAFIRPGMAADVEVHFGRRSVLSYLLDVVLRTRDEAFREY